MKSRITVEIDFDNNNQPVIRIMQKESDDVRDTLITAFLQRLQGGCWLKIKAVHYGVELDSRFTQWKISPIIPSELSKEIDEIKKYIELNG